MAKVLSKYPDKVPVVVKRAPGTKTSLPELKRWKFVVPRDLTLGQFIYVLRKQMTLPPEEALFLFIGNTLATTSSRMVELWAQYRAEDGALHVTYSGESAFG